MERTPKTYKEQILPETIISIYRIIDEKFNNPSVFREDPYFGAFVLDDKGQKGHSDPTQIYADRRFEVKIVVVKEFFENYPLKEPLPLIYSYFISEDEINFSFDNGTSKAPIVKKRIDELKRGGKINPLDKNDIAPSMVHGQNLLKSLTEMKIYIK